MCDKSIDFRVSEDNSEYIEIGIFEGEDCHDVIEISQYTAREYVKALQRAISESVGIWYACPVCGCTDVQVQNWVYVNTEEVVDSCGGYAWCVQCGNGADGEISETGMIEVDREQPFNEIG